MLVPGRTEFPPGSNFLSGIVGSKIEFLFLTLQMLEGRGKIISYFDFPRFWILNSEIFCKKIGGIYSRENYGNNIGKKKAFQGFISSLEKWFLVEFCLVAQRKENHERAESILIKIPGNGPFQGPGCQARSPTGSIGDCFM